MAKSGSPLSGLREQLARAIHEHYRQEQRGKIPASAPAMQPWEALREDLQESNRQQADQIPEKLHAVGYGLAPVAGRAPQKFAFTPEELEELAQMEHRRWMDEKLKSGWHYGPAKDADTKTHPCLVPWDQLSEEMKELDRQAVRQIPDLLAAARFEINKLE